HAVVSYAVSGSSESMSDAREATRRVPPATMSPSSPVGVAGAVPVQAETRRVVRAVAATPMFRTAREADRRWLFTDGPSRGGETGSEVRAGERGRAGGEEPVGAGKGVDRAGTHCAGICDLVPVHAA